MLVMPESPRYLVSKGQQDEAAKSLQRLRGKHYDVAQEMEKFVKDDEKQKSIGDISLKDLLTVPLYNRPLMAITMLMFVQQFAGINLIMFYTQEIFLDAGSDLDPGKANLYTHVPGILYTDQNIP